MALVFVFGRYHLDGGHAIACEILDVYNPLASLQITRHIFLSSHSTIRLVEFSTCMVLNFLLEVFVGEKSLTQP